MPEEPSIAVAVDKEARTFRVSMIGLLVFLTGYIVLWSDRHNDGRYVQRVSETPTGGYVQEAEYERDRVTDATLAAEKEKNLDATLARHQQWLESISSGVNQLLHRPQTSGDNGYPGTQPAEANTQ